jgi:two-component system, OmpR family, phosphate regulon response regulator PhoB
VISSSESSAAVAVAQGNGGTRGAFRARPRGLPAAETGRAPGAQPQAPRPCVLVVDDEAHDREIYGRTLCYNGFDVAFARSAAEALRLVDRHPVAVMVLDLGLPDLPGLELLQKLRERPSLRSTPVIVLSGFSREERGSQVRRAGCACYIEKPASPVAVLHAVEELVGRPPPAGVGTLPRIIGDDQ